MNNSSNQRGRGRHRLKRPTTSLKNKRLLTATAATLAATGGIQLAAATSSSAEVNPITTRTGEPMFTAPAPGTKTLFYKFDPSVNERGRGLTNEAFGNWNNAVHHPLFVIAKEGQNYQTLVKLVTDGGVSYSVPNEPINIAPRHFEATDWGKVLKQKVGDYFENGKRVEIPPGKLVSQEGYGDPRWDRALKAYRMSGSFITTPEEWDRYVHDNALRVVAHEAGHHLGLDHPINATADEVMIGTETLERGKMTPTDVDGKPYHSMPTGPNRLEAAEVMRIYGLGNSNTTPDRNPSGETGHQEAPPSSIIPQNTGDSFTPDPKKPYFVKYGDDLRVFDPQTGGYAAADGWLNAHPGQTVNQIMDDETNTLKPYTNKAPHSRIPRAAQSQEAGVPGGQSGPGSTTSAGMSGQGGTSTANDAGGHQPAAAASTSQSQDEGQGGGAPAQKAPQPTFSSASHSDPAQQSQQAASGSSGDVAGPGAADSGPAQPPVSDTQTATPTATHEHSPTGNDTPTGPTEPPVSQWEETLNRGAKAINDIIHGNPTGHGIDSSTGQLDVDTSDGNGGQGHGDLSDSSNGQTHDYSQIAGQNQTPNTPATSHDATGTTSNPSGNLLTDVLGTGTGNPTDSDPISNTPADTGSGDTWETNDTGSGGTWGTTDYSNTSTGDTGSAGQWGTGDYSSGNNTGDFGGGGDW
ncbi:hypothetical protein ABZ070_35435 [Streptomyces sp. NPDC006283]|uniref:hypothetical protein n=1 Tax=Streptomyces sp. NPDC006283 TaxID=3156741 RepID=UPI0033B90939